MSNRTILALAGTVAVLAAGFALGLSFRSSPDAEPALPKEVVRIVEVPRANPQVEAERLRLRQQVKELKTKIAEAPVVAPEPSEPPPAPPVPFPRELPKSFEPEGFREVLAETIKKCGMGLEIANVDCSEYPCIAWTKATDPSVHSFSMDHCAPWKGAFPDGELVIGEAGPLGEHGASRYFAWMPMPPDEQARTAVIKRLKERRKSTEQALGLAH